jgi:hypothetical protein
MGNLEKAIETEREDRLKSLEDQLEPMRDDMSTLHNQIVAQTQT